MNSTRMLHGTLPRAFLPPGLNYLGSYYCEDSHPYASHYLTATEDPYAPRITDLRMSSWSPITRPSSPLDLSLKPAPVATSSLSRDASRAEETIEVDDDTEDRVISTNPASNEPYPGHQLYTYPELTKASSISPRVYDRPVDSQNTIHHPIDHLSNVISPINPADHRKSDNPDYQLLLTPQHHLHSMSAPMTPPSTPSPPQCPRRRARDDNEHGTPSARTSSHPRVKKKHARRLKFDEDTSSPVSGTVILAPDEALVTGDIDPAFNIVEVTDEARAELAKIENRLGPYQCKLCRHLHEDAFQLAQHRCSRIAHVEYRCPECDKRFSCPANLASHRRWHKPRVSNTENVTATNTDITCARCEIKFSRPAALRKHLASQHPENNNSIIDQNCHVINTTEGTIYGDNGTNGKSQCVNASHGDLAIAEELP